MFVLGVALLGCNGTSPRQTGAADTTGSEVTFQEEEPHERPGAPPANEVVQRGERLLASGDAAGAQAAFRQAIHDNPRDARAHLDMGLALELGRDRDGAEREYRAAIQLDSTLAEAHNNLGVVLREKDDREGAVRELRDAVRTRRDFAEAHLNLALTLEEMGDKPGAIVSYREVLRLEPRSVMPRVNLGLLLLDTGEAQEAANELRRALPLASGNRAALAGIGTGLRRAGDGRTAVTALEAAIEAGDEGPTPPLLSELALAQRAAGDRAAAEATLARVLELDARYATAHYLLGNMLAGRGEYAEAIRHYERYLTLEPRGAQADTARERIRAARDAMRPRRRTR